MSKKISIIVPVHNGERYMAECLESVVRQSLRDIECVCIDDASTDSSPRILAQFAALDGRIHVLSQPEIRSASQARKDGVFAASGEYVMFLDADDMLLPDACESLEAEIKRQNVDLPGGRLTSSQRELTVKTDSKLSTRSCDFRWRAGLADRFPRGWPTRLNKLFCRKRNIGFSSELYSVSATTAAASSSANNTLYGPVAFAEPLARLAF